MSRSLFRPLAAFGTLAIVALVVGAQAPAPAISPADEKTAKMVVGLLERNHMAKPVIDDATAAKWVKAFLKDLDPQKYYFLKGDIDEFLPQAPTIDDKIREGNIDFARDVFARFLKRNDERLAMVLALVKEKPDFTLDESMADDPDVRTTRPTTPRPATASASGSSSNSSRPRSTTRRKTRRSRS